MYVCTYCQYVEEKGCCSCKKRREPLRLALPPFLRVIAPPLVLLDLARARSHMVLQWFFLQDLRDHFSQESRISQGCETRNSCSRITPLETLQDQTLVFCLAEIWRELRLWTIWRELLCSSKRRLGCIKKGANAPLLSEKEVPAKFTTPKCTNQVFLWYRLVTYRENSNRYQPNIPNHETTLLNS